MHTISSLKGPKRRAWYAGKITQREKIRAASEGEWSTLISAVFIEASCAATWAFAAVATLPWKSHRNWSERLPRDGRISRTSGLSALRRVSPRCNALIRIKVPRRGGRSLELAPNFFPITKEAHFMTGGTLFLLQRWRWSSCWGDPSISWLRKASCHVSVDPLVYYTVYICFFSSLHRGKLRLYDLGLLNSRRCCDGCDQRNFRYNRYWTSLPASHCGLKNVFANTWDRLIYARVNYCVVLKDRKKHRTDI